MSRVLERREVIKLRKLGKTYSEIKEQLHIPKSTLSYWLKGLELGSEELHRLSEARNRNKYLAIEKTRLVKARKRETRLKTTLLKEGSFWLPLSDRELLLAGLFLYWGEGNKNLQSSIALNNTDPKVLKFSLCWLTHGLKIPKGKIKVFLHLYQDMNVKNELAFWRNELNLPSTQFNRPYIKKNKREDIDQKGFGHGTCGLSVNNVRLKEKIILGITSIANHYSENLNRLL